MEVKEILNKGTEAQKTKKFSIDRADIKNLAPQPGDKTVGLLTMNSTYHEIEGSYIEVCKALDWRAEQSTPAQRPAEKIDLAPILAEIKKAQEGALEQIEQATTNALEGIAAALVKK